MKKAIFFLLLGLFIWVGATPVMSPSLGAAAASPVVRGDDPQAAPPQKPEAVSPANPSIQPPDLGQGRCMCGCPCCMGKAWPQAWKKGRIGRPQLGAGHMRGEGAGPMGGPGEAPGPMGFGMGRGVGERAEMGSRHGFDAGPRGGIAAERILRHAADLKLTDEQIKRLEALNHDTEAKLIDLRADIEKGELEIRNELQSGGDDLAKIKRYLDSVSKARAGVQEARIANFFDARKILTDEQKKMVKDAFPRLGMMLD